MLNLASKTRPEWLDEARADLATVLIDHAHCEKKAASTALALLFKYPDLEPLQRPLSALAREEMEHFELVLDRMDERGVAMGPMVPSPYAKNLLREVRRGEKNLLDTLLCCALIEARSCERMKLLSNGLPEDPELASFYGSLLASEARHHVLYTDLACAFYPESEVRGRLKELALHEAEVLAEASYPVRMHS